MIERELSGFALAIVAFWVASVGAPKGFIATAFCGLALFLKARQEEALLCRQFPAADPEYMRRVKGWVPYVL